MMSLLKLLPLHQKSKVKTRKNEEERKKEGEGARRRRALPRRTGRKAEPRVRVKSHNYRARKECQLARLSGRESKWAGTRRRIPQGPVKNNPGGPHHPFVPIYGHVVFFFFSSPPAYCYARTEPRGALPSGACSSCSLRGSSSALLGLGRTDGGARCHCQSPNVSNACFTGRRLSRFIYPKCSPGPAGEEGRHWTGRVNKSRRSHCSVTFSPSTANSGSSPRTHPPPPPRPPTPSIA